MFDVVLLLMDIDEEQPLNELNMVIVDRITKKGFILNNILPSNAPTQPGSNLNEVLDSNYVCLTDKEDIKECKSYLTNGTKYIIGVNCGFNYDNDKPLLKVKPCYLGTCAYSTENEIRIDFKPYVL